MSIVSDGLRENRIPVEYRSNGDKATEIKMDDTVSTNAKTSAVVVASDGMGGFIADRVPARQRRGGR